MDFVAYRMRAVLCTGEVHHAIDAGKSGPAAAVSMRVEFLLGQDVAARLYSVAETKLSDAGDGTTQLVLKWAYGVVRVFSWQHGGNRESDRRVKGGRISLISRGRGVREGGVVPGCDLLVATHGNGVKAKGVLCVCVMSVKIDLGVVMGGGRGRGGGCALSQPLEEREDGGGGRGVKCLN